LGSVVLAFPWVSEEQTLTDQVQGRPILSVTAEVIEGPDKGRSTKASTERLTIGSAEGNDLFLSDPTVSRYHLELVQCAEGVRVIDHGSRNGTFAGPVRIHEGVIPAGTVLRVGRSNIRVGDGDRVEVILHEGEALGGLRGRAPIMRRLMAQMERAAKSDASALIVGESGTGKELVARALHELGPRATQPFLTVDCGALSPTLVASELFGHERGAFTGADRQHLGAFERANKGTLFLDEIGELPMALQASLLGVLERRSFRRLGGPTEIAIDVRVIAATHRDLRADVNAGSFRLDLYYRIAVITLRVPPLRERTEDIPLLVEHFLRECGEDAPIDRVFSDRAMKSLAGHRWPGNVRELRNMVEAAVAMGEPPEIAEGLGPGASDADRGDLIGRLLARPYKEARQELLREFETRYVERLVQSSQGNIAKAAREARVDRTYLLSLIKKHRLR
jgi:DNA-binding NtrC family response regulator